MHFRRWNGDLPWKQPRAFGIIEWSMQTNAWICQPPYFISSQQKSPDHACVLRHTERTLSLPTCGRHSSSCKGRMRAGALHHTVLCCNTRGALHLSDIEFRPSKCNHTFWISTPKRTNSTSRNPLTSIWQLDWEKRALSCQDWEKYKLRKYSILYFGDIWTYFLYWYVTESDSHSTL
jgi:hypothetical protein